MNYALTKVEILNAQWRIIVAIMLHDLKTRFFGNEFGFLLYIAWPLTHILVLIAINAGLGRAAPYGESSALYFATGIIPFLAFQYMSRLISLGVILNRPLLSFPIIRITDILFARAIIEILAHGLVIIIVAVIFAAYGINFMPIDLVQACFALLAMTLLGLGFGVINAIIAAAFPFWATGYALLSLLFWFSSGIFYVPDALPEGIRMPLSYLPWLQGVEWMRSAYYLGYGATVLDKAYLLEFGCLSLLCGLLLERMVRGKLLQ